MPGRLTGTGVTVFVFFWNFQSTVSIKSTQDTINVIHIGSVFNDTASLLRRETASCKAEGGDDKGTTNHSIS